jgi:thioesterase domain-containing protein
LGFVSRLKLLFRGASGVRLNSYIQMQLFSELWSAWRSGQVLNSRAILFRATDPGLADRGWGKSCTDLTVIPVSGDHYAIFNADNLESLIARFVAALRREASKQN